MDTAPSILVVEDDDEIRALVCAHLQREGFSARGVADGQAMDLELLKAPADLIVLDIMLPGGEDGLTICRRLRASQQTPVIMLTARGEEIDRIIGIEIGADDYMAKPFNPRELSARIRAVLRRARDGTPRQASRARCAHLVIDFDRREVSTASGENLNLSSGEYALLTVFVSRPQRVLDRDQLMDLVSGRNFSGAFDRSIDVQISRLRKKVELDPTNPVLIKTVRNGGYILAEPVQVI